MHEEGYSSKHKATCKFRPLLVTFLFLVTKIKHEGRRDY